MEEMFKCCRCGESRPVEDAYCELHAYFSPSVDIADERWCGDCEDGEVEEEDKHLYRR